MFVRPARSADEPRCPGAKNLWPLRRMHRGVQPRRNRRARLRAGFAKAGQGSQQKTLDPGATARTRFKIGQRLINAAASCRNRTCPLK